MDGRLAIIVGGEAADLSAARRVLEAVGTTIVHAGPAGSGQLVKAANQLGSSVMHAKSAGMLERSFKPGFRIHLHHKDLGIVTTAARAAAGTTPIGCLVAQLMGAAFAQSDGKLDHSVLLLQIERLSGRSI